MDSKLLIAVVALVVVQLALQVTALVQLVRTPAERVSLGGRKWVWAVIIALGEIIGPIAWFVAGKTPEPLTLEAERTMATTKYAVDALYDQKD